MRYLRFVHIFYNARTRKGKGFLWRSRAAKVPGGVRLPILPAFVGFGSTSPPERACLMSGDKGSFLLIALRLACARVCAAMIKFVCGHGAWEMHLCALQVWDGSLLYYKYMRGKSSLQGAFALWHKIQDIMHKYSTLKNANIW